MRKHLFGFSKVARTIADLEGAAEPKHLSEAVQYRTLDVTVGVITSGECEPATLSGNGCAAMAALTSRAARNGTTLEGRSFRGRLCFGRGLILTRAPAATRPNDVVIIN